MPEYIKLKSALRILDNVMSDEGIKHKGKAIRKRLKELPTADVVEVVRCKVCKYGEADYGVYGDIVNPFKYHCLFEDGVWNKPAHFCSYGKRKEGAEE